MTERPRAILSPSSSPTSRRSGGGSRDNAYLADQGLSTALFCAARLPQPLLLEGEAGVGKTAAAQALAAALDTRLVRLQCYEGIDSTEALYEWNYARQLLGIRLAEARGEALDDVDLFTPEFLVERPLLSALRHPGPRPAVLLVDEVDRADDEFEAFLFELLAESSVTIPELGTQRAEYPPIVVLTSNRTRDLHDALKRRCLYHWIDYPGPVRASEIIRMHVPAARSSLADQVAAAVSRLRTLDVQKAPGHRRGDRVGRRAWRCSASRCSMPRPPSSRSVRCSSTATTPSSPPPARSTG